MKHLYGLTLLEVLVVLALIVVLSGFSLNWMRGMVKKHRIATEIQLLFSALNEARYLAFTRKATCGLVIGNNTFDSAEVRCDTDYDGDLEDQDGFQVLEALRFRERYISGRTEVAFSKEGFTSDTTTIRPQDTNILPEYSCILVSNTRIKMGRWEGGQCNPR